MLRSSDGDRRGAVAPNKYLELDPPAPSPLERSAGGIYGKHYRVPRVDEPLGNAQRHERRGSCSGEVGWYCFDAE